ncbi:DMT family transporter [Novosphingobium sp. PhB57]|uniref:DMT family transporter n=1 Tax=Novosphingobium sp. PhB57 TaxID=2485107 RepID=UPI001FB31EE6|nr:DMT family transporter [Novosphingobium sp. PhB57]
MGTFRHTIMPFCKVLFLFEPANSFYPDRESEGTMERSTAGWGSGLLGVIIFSGSLPATRVAVSDMSPLFVTSARAVIAALLGAFFLVVLRQSRPAREDVPSLAIVAIGVVAGFPLLTGLALQHITAAHSVVFVGMLPLSTAIFGVLRGGERPKPAFWLFSTMGGAAIAGFALRSGGGGSGTGDLLMVAAIVLCGLGYAEGARLARRLGGWQVISWALLIALPIMALVAVAARPASWSGIGFSAWLGFGYVAVFSMMLGFVFWYRGLALGGIAGVGQLQLLQPFLGLVLAGAVLGETVGWPMIASAAFVILCVAGAKRFA